MTALPPLLPGSFLLGDAADLRADMLGTCERVAPRRIQDRI